MTKGIAWRSPFLISTLVFVAGMAATIGLSYLFFNKAERDWDVRVDQTAERLSNTLLAWLEESYAPVSGLVALIENSTTVEPNEFINAFENMQSRSTTVLLDQEPGRSVPGGRFASLVHRVGADDGSHLQFFGGRFRGPPSPLRYV
jgi:two-component system sensor histidine kinase/response regulator